MGDGGVGEADGGGVGSGGVGEAEGGGVGDGGVRVAGGVGDGSQKGSPPGEVHLAPFHLHSL